MKRRTRYGSSLRCFAVVTAAAALLLAVPPLGARAPAGAKAAGAKALPPAARRAAPAAPPPPAVRDVRTLYEQGKDRKVLAALAKLLPARAKGKFVGGADAAAAAGASELSELWEIKGEILLWTRAPGALAAAAFGKAADLSRAAGDGTADRLRGVVLLLDSSPGLKYTPRGAGRKPIDAVEAGSRRRALEALYESRRPAAAPKLKAARSATQSGLVLAAAAALADLRAIELAGGGDGARTAELAAGVAAPAAGVLRATLDLAADRVAVIESRATEKMEEKAFGNDPLMADEIFKDDAGSAARAPRIVAWPQIIAMERARGQFIVKRLRGLTDGDDVQLRDAADAARRLAPAAEALAALSPQGADDDLRATAAEARDMARRVDYLLGFDFTGTEVEKVGDPDWSRRLAERNRRAERGPGKPRRR